MPSSLMPIRAIAESVAGMDVGALLKASVILAVSSDSIDGEIEYSPECSPK